MGFVVFKRVELLYLGLNSDCLRVGVEDKFFIVDEYVRKV